MGTKTSRQLAAVMFTDIVGYTAMMQDDEENASIQRARHRQSLEKRASEFDGKIMQYYGDGALTVFSSAYNAVMCAIAIQDDLCSPQLPLRIGIHMGDIVYEGNEVYGDAVNIAARLEPLSIAGGIVISEKVAEEIKNHPDIETKALGAVELKNVKSPVPIYAVSNEGIAIPAVQEIADKSGRPSNKIAVLPFVNMSDEIGFDYFSDGLTEEIINGLTKIDNLEVISRTSAFAFKGQNHDIRKIGEQLSVSHVLEGSVRKHKDKIRVTAQLIETTEGFHLWSETYDGHLKDIFEIQDIISEGILGKFDDGLIKEQNNRHASAPDAVKTKAYECYLEGKFHLDKMTTSAVNKAVGLFKNAVEEDPQFQKAYLDLAISYCYLGVWGQRTPQLAFEKAEKYLSQARENGAPNAECNALESIIGLFLYNDFESARNSFANNLTSGRPSARVWYLYAMYLNLIGQHQAAIECIEQALLSHPLNLTYHTGLGQSFYFAGRYQEALEQFDYVLELEPSYLPAIDAKGWVHVVLEQFNEARRTFEVYQNLVSQEQQNVPQLVYIAARMGMGDIAKHFLDLLQLGGSNDHYTSTSLDVALIYLGMKKYDEAFFHLQRAAEDKIGNILFIDVDPVWDSIKSDARYAKLKKRLGFTNSVQQISQDLTDRKNSRSMFPKN